MRWAERIGDTWEMIPRLANVVLNRSDGITKTKVQAERLLQEAQKALDCQCRVVRVALYEISITKTSNPGFPCGSKQLSIEDKLNAVGIGAANFGREKQNQTNTLQVR